MSIAYLTTEEFKEMELAICLNLEKTPAIELHIMLTKAVFEIRRLKEIEKKYLILSGELAGATIDKLDFEDGREP